MATQKPNIQANHSLFIWTIVILIVSGVSLASYIMITSIHEETELTATYSIPVHRATE